MRKADMVDPQRPPMPKSICKWTGDYGFYDGGSDS